MGIGSRGRKSGVELGSHVSVVQFIECFSVIGCTVYAAVVGEIHDIRICRVICIGVMIDVHVEFQTQMIPAIVRSIKIHAGTKEFGIVRRVYTNIVGKPCLIAGVIKIRYQSPTITIVYAAV